MGANPPNDKQLLSHAITGDLQSMRYALSQGIDPGACDTDGQTALHFVMRNETYHLRYAEKGREIASLLLNRGLDVNVKDAKGQTPLHGLATMEGWPCKYRLDDMMNYYGADIEARDNAGRTPIFNTLESTKADALQYFIGAGAKVNVADNDGVTPLHLAAAKRDAEHVKHLLNAGADLNAVTKDGKTVWDFAMENNKDYQAQWLKAEAAKQRAEREKKQAEERRKQEQEHPRDPWKLLSADRVAHVQNEPAIGYKLTEVFNFNARTYTHIAQNLNTKAEAVTVKTFDEFTDRSPLEKAHAQLERLGGTAERAVINGPLVEKPRAPGLKLPPAPK
jgi:ankyrin repeat protein